MIFSQIPQSLRTSHHIINGIEGLYQGIIPPGTHFAAVKDNTGFTTALIGNHGEGVMGQGRIIPIDHFTSTVTAPMNPAVAFAAIMLMNINHKLDSIKESQEIVLSLIDTQEHAQIKGNIKLLYETMSKAKLRSNDQAFKDDYRHKAIDIKQDAYQNIEK